MQGKFNATRPATTSIFSALQLLKLRFQEKLPFYMRYVPFWLIFPNLESLNFFEP